MLLKRLGKDLKRKKTMNIILLLFIILATMFVASGVNNVVTVMSGTDYYFDLAGIGDYVVITMGDNAIGALDPILEDEPAVENYRLENVIYAAEKNFTAQGEKVKTKNSVIIQSIGGSRIKFFDTDNREVTDITKGHAYVSGNFMEENHLECGDTIRIQHEAVDMTLVLSVCLIIVSFVVLRFTISFTIVEEYREIGVMKAIGMRNFSIQKIYFIKYLALVLAGALVGFGLSIPVGNVMMESVSKNMVLGDSTNTLGLNLVCSVAVVIFVAAMCILFTGKLKKISAIEAIRNGDNGERYHKRRGLNLHTKKRMGTIAFLGLNDILCNKKRYLVLFFTFCISFVLITVPLNTLTTMESREMVSKFSLDPDAAVYMETIEKKGDDVYHNTTDLEHALRRVERELAEKGYDASLSVGALFFVEWETGEDDTIIKYLTSYPIGVNGSYCEYTEGEAPKLENEVAFSKKVMEENELHIGDTVKTKINGEEKKFIITGYYSDYMQLGESARLNPAIDMSGEIMSGYWKPMVDMDTDLSQEEMVRKLEKEFPEYDWVTAQQVVDTNVGSVKDTMRAMQIPMTAMLCILIMLITILMMKLFIVREKGQLAMLKSIGYRNRHIRLWLMMRMVWVVMISMIFAIPLSMLSNRFVLTSIFAIMGAELRIQVEPVKAYLVYPGILLTGIVVATIVATMNVKKINTSDMKIAE